MTFLYYSNELMRRCFERFFVSAKSRKRGVAQSTLTERDNAEAEKNRCIKAVMIESSIKKNPQFFLKVLFTILWSSGDLSATYIFLLKAAI